MDAEAENNRKAFFRKPSHTRCITTLLVITYVVWCVLVSTLTATGHLVKRQTVECGNGTEVSISLEKEAILVYVCSSVSLPVCILLLVEIWIRKFKVLSMLLIASAFLSVTMVTSFAKTWEKDNQEIQEFKEYYLALIPLAGRRPDTIIINCRSLRAVHRWQAEYKCCGLEGYQDWGSTFPETCLCEGKNNSSGCVEVRNSLVYEKPCLPTVLLDVEKRNTTFWIVMLAWVIITNGLLAGFVMLVIMASMWFFTEAFICNPCCNRSETQNEWRGGTGAIDYREERLY